MVRVAFAGRAADALLGDGEAIAEAEADGEGETTRPGDGLAKAEGDGAAAGLTGAVVGAAAGAAVGELGAADEQAVAASKSVAEISAMRRCTTGVLSMYWLAGAAVVPMHGSDQRGRSASQHRYR